MSEISAGVGDAALSARRYVVRGRVQGVYYRASARRQALAMGVTGHARNLPDGSVEVIAWGSQAAVQAFVDWLWIGPAAAKVSEVLVEPLQARPGERPFGFSTS